jgi:glycine/D-amino acid oxidase-like deaminating enzyme
MHVNLYASMTRELSEQEIKTLGGESEWAFTPADPLGSTLRRISGTGGDRLLIRNRCTYEPNLKLPTDRLDYISADHDRTFYARFPMLKRVSMAYRWSGRLCLSRNNVWAIGELDKNLFSACCQNGLGTTRGTIAGIVAAEMACEKRQESLLPDFAFEESPTKLFPEPFMSLGARNYLKYREWRAGREL